MNLKTYLKGAPRGEAARLAAAVGTTVDYVYQLTGGHRFPSRKLALRIKAETNGAVTLDDWAPLDAAETEGAAA